MCAQGQEQDRPSLLQGSGRRKHQRDDIAIVLDSLRTDIVTVLLRTQTQWATGVITAPHYSHTIREALLRGSGWAYGQEP